MDTELLIQRIRERMDVRGLKVAHVNVKAGLNKSFLGDLFRGKKKNPGIFHLEKIAKVLDVDVEYLLGKQDIPRISHESKSTPKPGNIFISGIVRSGGFVDFNIEPGSLGEVPLPPGEDGAWYAVQVEKKAYHPVLRDGDILYYQKHRLRPEVAQGKESFVEIDQALYLRVIWPGDDGLWNLTAPTSEPLMNVALSWVYKLAWVRK